jgi:Mce-associated membrane protein
VATEIFPAYPDDAEDQQQPNQARDAAPAEPVAHAEPAAPDRVEAAVSALLKPPVLVAVLLVLAALGGAGAYYLEGKASEASLAYPTVNQALIDKAATAQVTADVSRAIEAAYSYDSTELDVDENRALSFLTGSYVDQFKQNFDQVRQLGPQARLSLQSKVSAIGVETLSDDNAKLLVMLNQIGRRNDHAQPLTAGVRLSVSAEKVDGQWKVSEVEAK